MKTIVLGLFLFIGSSLIAQQKIKWSIFERLQFEEVFDEESATWLVAPIWTSDLKKLDGKQVHITGYIISLDVIGNEYALSAFPFASCFFCGASGPESVMELRLKEEAKFLTDDVHEFEGTLVLNDGTGTFPLSLINAQVVE